MSRRSTTSLLPLHAFALAAVLTAAPALAQPSGGEQVGTVLTAAGPIAVENLADGLDHPWGLAFLPDGRLLVTVRNTGSLHILGEDGALSDPVDGTPVVFAEGHGGLMDVALDPDFASNGFVYEGVEDYGSRLSMSRLIDSSTIASLDAGSVS